MTSRSYADPSAVTLENGNFKEGSLSVTSYARPGKLFTASSDLVTSVAGILRDDALERLIDAVVQILRARIV